MFAYHATPKRNSPSIEKHGLLRSFSCTPGEGIWLHSPDRRAWAVKHVAARHKCRPDEVVVYLVCVNDRQVVKHSCGVFTAYVNIPAACITLSSEQPTA